ncbi:electron transfer flavoprotein subunit beta/FixA family protein [bacterium]|nr:electron transfer flavoprotein subunit beta/FixA family protein [candidate division CSSED10-310 bacterium]
MKIIVFVKRVPDTESRIVISGTDIDTSDFSYIVNPYDEYAVEEALKIQESMGGEVVIMTLGRDAVKEIRNALAMGADRAVYLEAEAPAGDTYATARILAAALMGESFDLLLFGKMAVDDGAAAVGPMVAELLGLPCVSSIDNLEVAADRVVARMPIEGGAHVMELPLPAVVTADKGLNEPRYPSLRGIMQAKRKPMDSKAPEKVEAKFSVLELQAPPPRPPGKIVGDGVAAVPKLVELLRVEAKVI